MKVFVVLSMVLLSAVTLLTTSFRTGAKLAAQDKATVAAETPTLLLASADSPPPEDKGTPGSRT